MFLSYETPMTALLALLLLSTVGASAAQPFVSSQAGLSCLFRQTHTVGGLLESSHKIKFAKYRVPYGEPTGLSIRIMRPTVFYGSRFNQYRRFNRWFAPPLTGAVTGLAPIRGTEFYDCIIRTATR